MKNILLAALLLLTACSSVKPTADENRSSTTQLITFKVRNNSVLVHKYALIGYNPGETGNWTNIITLLPGAHRKLTCPVGTKIYQASDKQVGTVMGGGSIREDEPFLTVKVEDKGKSFGLND